MRLWVGLEKVRFPLVITLMLVIVLPVMSPSRINDVLRQLGFTMNTDMWVAVVVVGALVLAGLLSGLVLRSYTTPFLACLLVSPLAMAAYLLPNGLSLGNLVRHPWMLVWFCLFLAPGAMAGIALRCWPTPTTLLCGHGGATTTTKMDQT